MTATETLLAKILYLDGYCEFSRYATNLLVLDGTVSLTPEEKDYVEQMWLKGEPS